MVDSREGFFGAATRQAVLDFWKQRGVETTGVVDDRTAMLISAVVNSLHAESAEHILVLKRRCIWLAPVSSV